MNGTPRVREDEGIALLREGTLAVQVDPSDYVAIDIQDAAYANRSNAIWYSITLINRGANAIRVALEDGAADTNTVTVESGDAPLYLKFRPRDQRRYVYLRAEGADVDYHMIPVYEIIKTVAV